MKVFFGRNTSSLHSGLARVMLSVLVVASLSISLSSCSNTAHVNSSSTRILTFGIGKEGKLDPTKDGGGEQRAMRALAYEALTHIAADGSVQPGLATSWNYVGSGNTVFEFTLRKEVRFSDGAPVTPDAVKKWFQYFPTAKGPYAAYVSIKAIDVVGDATVRLTLNKPNPILPVLISDQWTWGSLASPNALDAASLGTKTFGAGPYMLDPSQTVAGDHYTYVPNPNYYDKAKIRFQKVVSRIVADPNSMLQAATSGQLQVAFGNASTAPQAAAKGLNVVHAPGSATTMLLIYDRSGKLVKPLADVRVRQALNYAVDRKAIASALVGPYGKPTSQLLTTDGHDPAYDALYPYDPVKAKSLLEEAGYPNGFAVDVLVYGPGGLYAQVAQATAKDLMAIGVTVRTTTAATDSEYTEKATSGRFPVGTTPFGSVPMWISYGLLFANGASQNVVSGTTSDPVLDQLWQQSSSDTDPIAEWKQMSRRITEQAMTLTILANDVIFYTAKDIAGVEMSAQKLIPLASEWYVNG